MHNILLVIIKWVCIPVVSLSIALYHTWLIFRQGCKWPSLQPKLTSSLISDIKSIIYIFLNLRLHFYTFYINWLKGTSWIQSHNVWLRAQYTAHYTFYICILFTQLQWHGVLLCSVYTLEAISVLRAIMEPKMMGNVKHSCKAIIFLLKQYYCRASLAHNTGSHLLEKPNTRTVLNSQQNWTEKSSAYASLQESNDL